MFMKSATVVFPAMLHLSRIMHAKEFTVKDKPNRLQTTPFRQQAGAYGRQPAKLPSREIVTHKP